MTCKIAFLCLAHNNFQFIEQVSHYYCSEGDGFFLHIDKQVKLDKSPKFHKDTIVLDNDERYRSRWGTINIVQATLALLTQAVKQNQYDKFILVSGADVPLLSKRELKSQLSNDLSYFSVWSKESVGSKAPQAGEFFHRHHYHNALTNPGEAYLTKRRFNIYIMLLLNKMIALLPSSTKFTYPLYAKGSQWWCISKELAQYMLAELNDSNAMRQFAGMHAPDEKVFHTIAINSPFADKLVIDQSKGSLKQALHYIDWGLKKGKTGLQIFTLDNLSAAKKLGCCFARKMSASRKNEYLLHVKSLLKPD